MINLDVKSYCHNCPNFEPNTQQLYSFGEVVQTTITCEHRGVCDCIEEHLKKNLGGNKNDKN